MQTQDKNTQNPSDQKGAQPKRDEKVEEALKQAEHDIEEDPDFQEPDPTADMDEGEIARYEAGEDPREQATTES